jgi:alanyl-tRNA synthetase
MLTREDLLKPEHFNLKFFKQNGFLRQKCKKCGNNFWATVQQDECGDASCVSYNFIGSPVIPGKLTWKKIREKYIKFFENNGHQFVKRYPVVARWKPDTLFTGAGIFNYMPWVLNGSAKPPANPALTDQPSVRFVDIDNVGLGTGRHCTEFSMLGHHVFNSPKQIYWKEKAIELCHGFFTSELKLPLDKISFVENLWKGGGNAGPCFEVMSGGNEIATMVFMEFEDRGGIYSPMKMKVVDPGYGLERIAWASQGTPTIYDSIYPKVIKFLRKEGRIKSYNKKVFEEFCKLSSCMNVEDVNVEEERKILIDIIGKKLGTTPDEIMEQVYPYHNIYRIADHSKALAFILGDGVVPSNIQEGYLARLLIRRALHSIRNLGMALDLGTVVEQQINEVKDIYPELDEKMKNILKMVESEEEKYKSNMKNASGNVKKFQDILLRGGKKKFDKKSFVMLYESYGLNPEIVKEHLDLPSESVTALDIKEEIRKNLEEEETRKKRTGDYQSEDQLAFLDGLPQTEILYYEKEDLFNFEARVLKVFDNLVVLDKSGFYPRGGGAEPDLGTIGSAKVIDVEKKGNIIVHTIEGQIDSVTVKCSVDMDRRDRIVRHHTGAHVINGACQRVLGPHIWQRGTRKGANKAHLDVSHYEIPSPEQIRKIENISNELIKKKVNIEKKVFGRTEAEQKFGFRIYQGGVVPGEKLKIVNIPGWDAEACGGLHKNNTSEVGKIIISKIEKPHDGVIRLVFRAGPAAEDWLVSRTNILKESAKVLGVKDSDLPKAVKQLLTKWKTLRKRLEIKNKKEAADLAKKIKSEKVGSIELVVQEVDGDMKKLQEMSRTLGNDNTFITLFGIGEKISVFCSAGKNVNINAGLITSKLCSDLGGKGGGSPTLGRGFGVDKSKLAKIKDKIKKELIV